MTRIQAGSNSTLIAVASIPPRIWEQDKKVWRAWYESLSASIASRQQYKRYIADFLHEINKSISEITNQDILDYGGVLSTQYAPNTVNSRIGTIRAYWKFAQEHKEATV